MHISHPKLFNMCATKSNSIYIEYFYFTGEYYLHLDGKRFWMLNITRVIDFFSPRMTLGKKTETERRISL